ncbi:thioesterase family protein [Marivita sp. GX14005]|uniref:acyl-CoA thioesterase n=1 Tax=Marivita sp. GX14005 TaxID=2942276 RepID=UPI0020188209|nr:thioesterase family protein [Marivita sp. GX14005]MCL3883439.1 acyl-CoA thioesterase [Marivita sp. GX14005]
MARKRSARRKALTILRRLATQSRMTDLPFLTPLSPEQQRAADLAEPWPLAHVDRVRFSELDPLGHVNNVAYLTWFEIARVAYFKHIGLSRYRDAEAEPRIVIRRGELDWLKEMHADEPYVITSKTVAYRTSSFTMAQEVWSGGTQRAAFRGVIVLLRPDGSGKMPIPQAIRDHFHQVDGVPRDQE